MAIQERQFNNPAACDEEALLYSRTLQNSPRLARNSQLLIILGEFGNVWEGSGQNKLSCFRNTGRVSFFRHPVSQNESFTFCGLKSLLPVRFQKYRVDEMILHKSDTTSLIETTLRKSKIRDTTLLSYAYSTAATRPLMSLRGAVW